MKRVLRPRRVSALLVLRQLLSMVLMLGGSGGLLLFLQRLLTEIDLLSLLSEAIADLIRGLQQLAEALVGFGSLVLIASLVVLIAVLLLGGSLRALRLVRLALGSRSQLRRRQGRRRLGPRPR